MKIILFVFISTIVLCSDANSQNIRYFEFTTNCEQYGTWQDSSFIASASDQSLINEVLQEIKKPLSERRFISGPISYGNGGFNHNGNHWFLWHFIPGQWKLVGMAAEVCDGCPYSDVDTDTAYWIGNIGHFCPWYGKPIREVLLPNNVSDKITKQNINIFPNPADEEINIILKDNISWSENTKFEIINSLGVPVHLSSFDLIINNELMTVSLSRLTPGLYFFRISDGQEETQRNLFLKY